METELEQLQQEIQSLEAIKNQLEEIKNAKLQKLKLQIGTIPSRFSAEHPVLSYLAGATASTAKGLASTGTEAAKELASGTGKVAQGIGNYLEWSKANPGKGWLSYLAAKKKMEQLPQQPKQIRV